MTDPVVVTASNAKPREFVSHEALRIWQAELPQQLPEGTTVRDVFEAMAKNELPFCTGEMFEIDAEGPWDHRVLKLQACAVGEAAWQLGVHPDAITDFLASLDCAVRIPENIRNTNNELVGGHDSAVVQAIFLLNDTAEKSKDETAHLMQDLIKEDCPDTLDKSYHVNRSDTQGSKAES